MSFRCGVKSAMILPQAKSLTSYWPVSLKAATKFRGLLTGCTRGLASSSHQANEPWITATPRVCLHDVPTTLRAGGLSPHSPVTLSATLIDEKGIEFCSCAHYVTDGTGNVDVRTAESVGGSYKGVFPAGLLTTLRPAPHELQSHRLYRRNTSLPWKIQVSVLDAHQPPGTKAEAMAKLEMERLLMAPGVRRVLVHEGRVRAALYLPPGDGPFPGVVDMFGSVGGLMEFRSALLASRGFASLALAFFKYDDLPQTTEYLDLSYFEEAVEVLLAVPGVIPDRCGAVANSRTGDILLTMATLLPAVKAVVGINCSTIAIESGITYRGKVIKQGLDVEQVSFSQTETGSWIASFQEYFTDDNPAMIHVEEADEDTHFLLVAGEDDSWGFQHSLAPFQERMLNHNKHNFETVLYPGTGHLIEPPYNAFIKQSFHRHSPTKQHSPKGIIMQWGGEAQSTCTAQEDLWQRMRIFLMNHVQNESPWYQHHLTHYTTKTPSN